MRLYLVQHGEARSKEEDPGRGLSEKGIQDITKIAQYVSNLGIKTSRVFHSGKTRALQTARVLADYLKVDQGITEAEGLSPMDDPRIWSDRISGMQEDIMLVGHLPHLAVFSSLLLCGAQDKNIINFKMAGIVCLQRAEDGNWAIDWMITPEVVHH
ncbi:MAG: phosphohistidine phosphatase SixA [Nitrospiraceae bacterium]|nr:MAG: phosphohistidine phosphatase SixA [Nitrospiraceae bacterium]